MKITKVTPLMLDRYLLAEIKTDGTVVGNRGTRLASIHGLRSAENALENVNAMRVAVMYLVLVDNAVLEE